MIEQLLPGLASAPNLHPMAVHFPIAFWVAATGAWLFAVAAKRDDAWRFGRWLHLFALIGAAAAVGLGFWATEKMGHDSPGHDRVHVHRDIMLWASAVAVVVTGLSWWPRSAKLRVPLTLLSGVLFSLVVVGADRGAELVFRYGMGVAFEAPPDSADPHAHGDDHAEGHEHQDPQHVGPEGAAAGSHEGSGSREGSDSHHAPDARGDTEAGSVESATLPRDAAAARPEPAPHRHDPSNHQH